MNTKKHYPIIIIGAGISGLTIGNALIDKGIPKEEILVLEAEDQIGGLIETTITDGYLCEGGPEGLRGKSENTQKIFELIDQEPIPATDQASIRYLVDDSELVQVPTGPWSGITTSLLSITEKLRLLKEPFVSAVEEDENVHEFFVRRLGKGVAPIIDAFVSGIYGGDPHQLSITHAFPTLKELEQQHGSLLRGMMKRKKQKKKEKDDEQKQIETKGNGNAEPEEEEKPPFLYSTKSGMSGIIEGLAKKLNIITGQRVDKIKLDNKYQIHTTNHKISADQIIVATGVSSINKIKFQQNETTIYQPSTVESNVTVVNLGFPTSSFYEDIEGYGFLAPSKEDSFLLGALFDSSLFPDHAPEDTIQLRCFVGGRRNPEYTQLNDQKMIDKILTDLRDLLPIQYGPEYEPEFVKIIRHDDRGIPQLQMGHERLIQWKEKMENKEAGLYFAGVGWTSISCDGLIGEAFSLATTIYDRYNSNRPTGFGVRRDTTSNLNYPDLST